MQIRNEPLTELEVRDFLNWRYDAPYDIYNLETTDLASTIAFFLDGDNGYFAVYEEDDTLFGFCCFGFEGRVSGGDYSLDALDVGIGMRPELTGQGLGYDFVGAVLAHAEEAFAPQRLRATIALFNQRSQRVFEKHGFQRQSLFTGTARPRQYVILTKESSNGSRQGASAIDA
jgi:ribosomal-protein-alanine N-acetyltransferase